MKELIIAVQTVPFALQNASHSAAVFRQATSAPFFAGGVLAPSELVVSAQATPNMSIVLGPGRAKVPGTSVSAPASGLQFTTQAMYDVFNDANATYTVAAANATNPRIDAVYIGVQDSFYSGSTNQAIGGIVTGVAAATPVVPAVPSNAILLATIAVAANATSISAANISTASRALAALSTGPGFVRSRTLSIAQSNANGTVLGSITIPAAPVAQRVQVTVNGALGFSSNAGQFDVGISASNGATVTDPGNTQVTASGGQWGGYAHHCWVDVVAGSATVITFTNAQNSGANSYIRVVAEARAFLVGEFA